MDLLKLSPSCNISLCNDTLGAYLYTDQIRSHYVSARQTPITNRIALTAALNMDKTFLVPSVQDRPTVMTQSSHRDAMRQDYPPMR